MDGLAAFVRLLGLVARTQLTLSQIDARIPEAHVLRRTVPTPWAAKGAVMRAVFEAAGDRASTPPTGSGSSPTDGSWVLVLPDPDGGRHPPVGRGARRATPRRPCWSLGRVVEEAAGG